MTLLEMEEDVRQELLDTEASAYRFTSVFIMNAIYNGVKVLFKVRPESRYNGVRLASFEIPRIKALNLTEEQAKTLPIDPRWNDALIAFAVGDCFSVDSADTTNAALADKAYAKFNSLAKL